MNSAIQIKFRYRSSAIQHLVLYTLTDSQLLLQFLLSFQFIAFDWHYKEAETFISIYHPWSCHLKQSLIVTLLAQGFENQTWTTLTNIHIRLQPIVVASWAHIRRNHPFVWHSMSVQSVCLSHIDREEDNGAKMHDPHCVNLLCVAWLCFCAWAALSLGQLAPVPVLQSTSQKGEVDWCQMEHTDP